MPSIVCLRDVHGDQPLLSCNVKQLQVLLAHACGLSCGCGLKKFVFYLMLVWELSIASLTFSEMSAV